MLVLGTFTFDKQSCAIIMFAYLIESCRGAEDVGGVPVPFSAAEVWFELDFTVGSFSRLANNRDSKTRGIISQERNALRILDDRCGRSGAVTARVGTRLWAVSVE